MPSGSPACPGATSSTCMRAVILRNRFRVTSGMPADAHQARGRGRIGTSDHRSRPQFENDTRRWDYGRRRRMVQNSGRTQHPCQHGQCPTPFLYGRIHPIMAELCRPEVGRASRGSYAAADSRTFAAVRCGTCCVMQWILPPPSRISRGREHPLLCGPETGA